MIVYCIRKILWKILGAEPPQRLSYIERMKKDGVQIGNNVDLLNCSIDSRYGSIIEIGNNVTIVCSTILAHDASTKKTLGYTKVGCVSIGDNVFIGHGTIILPGTKIGNNVIVGAGSVVRGNIPDDSIAIGNPIEIVGSTKKYMEKHKEKINVNNVYDMCNQNDYAKMKRELNNRSGYIL